MPECILAIDQGTTLTQATVYDRTLTCVATASEEVEFDQSLIDKSEQDPDALWHSVIGASRAALNRAGFGPGNVAGIALTNQRETTVVWDRHTGQPAYPAISWQDRRTETMCNCWRDEGRDPLIKGKTGLTIAPYFSGPKLAWILDNVPAAREKAEAGKLCFGTLDSFILWHLTGGRVHATDATNAARTLLFNIHEQQWDRELLHLFNIPSVMMPDVRDNAADFGVSETSFIGAEVPICGLIGDQQGILVAQNCLNAGNAEATYSTGCFALVNTGDRPATSQNRLLTTLAYRIDGVTTYAVEGSIAMAGSVIDWLRDDLKVIQDEYDIEHMARTVPLNQQEVVVPALTGFGAPHWEHNAQGAIFGISRKTRADNLVAATLRSIAFQTEDLLRAMRYDALQVDDLKVDGGALITPWFLQSLADITGVRILTSRSDTKAARGAAMMAALQLDWSTSLHDMRDGRSAGTTYHPSIDDAARDILLRRWDEALFRIQAPLA